MRVTSLTTGFPDTTISGATTTTSMMTNGNVSAVTATPGEGVSAPR